MFELTSWDWLGLGMVLLVLELVISGVFLFWVGLAALTVGIFTFISPGLPWTWQFVLFAILTTCYVLAWSFLGGSRKKTEEAISTALNVKTADFIGQIRVLSEAIDNGRGAVVIDDSRWVVVGLPMSQGTRVKIVKVEGMLLHVEAAD